MPSRYFSLQTFLFYRFYFMKTLVFNLREYIPLCFVERSKTNRLLCCLTQLPFA
jgi:hypothetical protein